MTTIACDGEALGADGRVTDGHGYIVADDAVKVDRLSNGALIALAGRSQAQQMLVEWLESEEPGEFPNLGEFEAVMLLPDGTGRFYNNTHLWEPCAFPVAIGSGGPLALGAMLAGKTAAEAVAIACLRDTASGGKITALSLKP